MRELARGLQFPEGPISLDDGSVLVVEVRAGALTRIGLGGEVDRIVACGGGPSGAALGPQGKVFLCNSIGAAGRIQVADLESGRVQDLYVECGGRPLHAPGDLVMDGRGGFYFTDSGGDEGSTPAPGGLYYARCDGSEVVELAHSLQTPRGVGLSPGGRQLVVAESSTARLLTWPVLGPGQLGEAAMVATVSGHLRLASLALERDGSVAVVWNPLGGGTRAAVAVVTPGGQLVEHVAVPAEGVLTNLCFGGPRMRTAYITASGMGTVFETEWARPGLPLPVQEMLLP